MTRRLRTYLEFTQQFEKIETRLVVKSANQVRDDPGDLSELGSSIKVHGLLQPILVRPKNSHFEVVCGNRRFEACKRLMMRHLDCIVKELSDKEAFEVSLIENVQRRTLNPIEEAKAYRRYVSEYGWGGASDLAKKIGKSQEYVSHRIALLGLPDSILAKIGDGRLSASQAQELTWVRNTAHREIVFGLIEKEELSVRRIRRLRKEFESSPAEVFGSYEGRNDPASEGLTVEERSQQADLKHVADAILALRIALVRLDSAIPGIDSPHVRDSVMQERVSLHTMIDRLIRLKLKLRPG